MNRNQLIVAALLATAKFQPTDFASSLQQKDLVTTNEANQKNKYK